jgi:hypothetical protein
MSEATSLQAQELGSDHWGAFTAAASDEAFCLSWLALQCGRIPGARAGLLLLRDRAGQSYVPAAADK